MNPGSGVVVLIVGQRNALGIIRKVRGRDGRRPLLDIVVVTDTVDRTGSNVSITLLSVPHCSDTDGGNPIASWEEWPALVCGPAKTP